MKFPVERITPSEFQCKGFFCKFYNHWLNPFGNWLEPLPFPEKYKVQASTSFLPPMLWWTLRNPLHNFMHHYIGIVPLGERYCWINPAENGWTRVKSGNWSWWKKKLRIPLPYYNKVGETFTYYIGWTSRGNFGVAFRKTKKPS